MRDGNRTRQLAADCRRRWSLMLLRVFTILAATELNFRIPRVTEQILNFVRTHRSPHQGGYLQSQAQQ